MSMDGTVEIAETQTATCDAGQGGLEAAEAAARTLGEQLGQALLVKGADKLLEGIIGREGTGLQAPQKQ